MKKLTEKQKDEIEFNNGFITAIGLFLAHERDEWYREDDIRRLTLYTASDHLFDMEIPASLPKKIKDKISKLKNEAFKCRLIGTTSTKCNEIFNGFKDILKDTDEWLWKKEVCIKYY